MNKHEFKDNELDKRVKYIEEILSDDDDLLKDVVKRTLENTDPIHIRPEEAKLLQFLIKTSGIKTIVEIGTLAGYSAISMARALPDDGHLYTIEKDETRLNMARESLDKSDVKNKISLIHGDAILKLQSLESKAPFDMIFIDADKRIYLDCLDWAEKNIKKGGLIIGDNSFLFGAVYDDEGLEMRVRKTTVENMKEFNLRLADNKKYATTIIPSKQGMTIAYKLY